LIETLRDSALDWFYQCQCHWYCW